MDRRSNEKKSWRSFKLQKQQINAPYNSNNNNNDNNNLVTSSVYI